MKFPVACLLPCVLLLSGCDRARDATVPTLVVDPVPIAKSLGRDELMQQQLNEQIEKLNAELSRQTNVLNKQLEQQKKELGGKPDPRATKAYEERLTAATQQIKTSQLQAQQQAAAYRQSLLAQFNTEVRAVAAEIAKARGASAVLVIAENVLWFDPAADITAEVIEKLRAQAVESPHDDANAAQKQELKNLENVIQSIEKGGQPAR